MQCRGTPEDCEFGHELYSVLLEVREGNKSPISNVVSELEMCTFVRAHAHVYTGSFTAMKFHCYGGGVMLHTCSGAFGICSLERAAHPQQMSISLSS